MLVTAVAAGPRPLAITHVNVIDATGAPVRQDTTVVVTSEGITAMSPSGTVKIPAGVRVSVWIRPQARAGRRPENLRRM